MIRLKMEHEMESIEEILNDRIALRERQLVKLTKSKNARGISWIRVILDELHILKNRLVTL